MRLQWTIAASDRGVTAIRPQRPAASAVPAVSANAAAERWRAAAEKELRNYFAGRLTSFAAPFDISFLPSFTQAVLKLTAKIPYGEIRTYDWLAGQLGKPKAARAVGNALGRNPVPIIIPCHRVVRSDGAIGGFALGAAWKKRLLSLEKRFANPQRQPKQHVRARAKGNPSTGRNASH